MGKGQAVPEVVDHSNVGRDWKRNRADCKSDEKEVSSKPASVVAQSQEWYV